MRAGTRPASSTVAAPMLRPDDPAVLERAASLLEAGIAFDHQAALAIARNPALWPKEDPADGTL